MGLYVADEWIGVNDLGIVQWSGTSFATPLVTAFAAAIWSASLRAGRAIDAEGVLEAIVKNPDGSERRLIPLGHA